MGLESVIKYLLGELSVITQAPVAILTCLIVIFGLVWALARWRYGATVEHLENRIKLRDDQVTEYKNKLSGASPDEAKARLDALETQLKALSPRRLSSEQRDKIRNTLMGVRGVIEIAHDLAAADAKAYVGDFIVLFQEQGWIVSTAGVMGLGMHPRTGVALQVADPAALRPMELRVRRAFEEAGIAFDLQPGLRIGRPGMPASAGFPGYPGEAAPDVGLILTTRLD